jgi:hypothetical protein
MMQQMCAVSLPEQQEAGWAEKEREEKGLINTAKHKPVGSIAA